MSCLSSWFSHKRPIFAAVLLATVTAGLYPRNYHFRNGARWSEKGAGLEFGEHGAAFTEPFLTDDLAAQCVREGFTLEVALAGAEDGPEGFGFIAHFYAGSERSQLLLGQWRDWLVVMNGDDYAHRRGTPRISMQLSRPSRIAHLVTITSGPAGTRLFFDGHLTGENASLVLSMPSTPHDARLVLGNAADGTHSWPGRMCGFTFLLGTPAPAAVAQRFQEWRDTGNFSLPGGVQPQLLYTFEEKGGDIAHDGSPNHITLSIPERDIVAEKQLLRFPAHGFALNRSFFSDFVVNLFGFIPFGFALSSLLQELGIRRIFVALSTTVIAAALSFGIEWAQMWLPSRDSSLLDLTLNTLGGILGTAVFYLHASRCKGS